MVRSAGYSVADVFRQQHFDRLAVHLLSPVTENPLRHFVREHDVTFRVHSHDRLCSRFHQRARRRLEGGVRHQLNCFCRGRLALLQPPAQRPCARFHHHPEQYAIRAAS